MNQEDQILKLVEQQSAMNAQLQTVIKTLDDIKEQLANANVKDLKSRIEALEVRVTELEKRPASHALTIVKEILKYVGTLALGFIVAAVIAYVKNAN